MFFFFNDTATTEIYTLSLHDALPISRGARLRRRRAAHADRSDPVRRLGRPVRAREDGQGARHREPPVRRRVLGGGPDGPGHPRDRKSTRLNSSHANISYAVFCLKKKK